MATETDSLPLIRTKLYRPRIAGGLVPRPRLLERLEERRGRPLTLVSAPAGYGKTTLISGWVEVCDCPSAWVSLDEGDDDLVLFLTYLLAAIETMFPSAVAETQALLRAASLPPLPALTRSLINGLDQIECSFILVLDDYHYIRNIAIHDLLNDLLAYPPRSMHLALISRKDPPLNLVRLRARRQVTEVRTPDLRFTREETAAFVRQEMGAPIDDSAVGALLQRVEGWVTGLRLVTLSLRHQESVEISPARLQGGVSYVAEYLAAEVLESQPQVIQDYLLSTSILDRFCASLCQAVQFGTTGLPKTDEGSMTGQAFVEWLEENDPFLVRLDDRGEWYRYHQLFQELLQRRLEQQSGGDGIATLHRRASTWFAKSNLIDKALHHAFAAGEFERAVQLVAGHRHDLIDRERWQHLEHRLRLFDRATIDQSPELSITEAWLMNHHTLIQQEYEALDRTAKLLAETDLPSEVADPIRGEVYLLRANLLGWHNRASEALAMVAPAKSLLPAQWRYAHAAISMIQGLGYAQQGEAELAEQSILAGLNEHHIGENPRHKSLLLYALTTLDWTSLDLQGLKQSAARYLEYGQRFDLQETEAVAQHFLGCAHYHHNELSEAEAYFRTAASNPYKANRSFYTQAVCGLAFTYRALGRHQEALELLGATRSDMMDQLGPLLLGVLQAGQAEVTLAEGDIARAFGWVEAYDPQPIAGLQMFFIPQTAFIKVLLAQNTSSSLGRAAALLTQYLELARKNHFKSALLYALPLQALLNARQGQEAAAMASLEEAVRLGEVESLVRVFVDVGPGMADLLVRLSRRGVAVEYIAQILAAYQTPPARDATGGSVEPLTGRELEILALVAQGLSNKEIAARLVLSTGTVKNYTSAIYKKLGVKKRRQAVAKAVALGILPSNDE